MITIKIPPKARNVNLTEIGEFARSFCFVFVALKDPDAASCFLQCVGSPASNTGRDHMQNLKAMLEAAIDIYTFMVGLAHDYARDGLTCT